ncbi:hypothetical protein HJ526_01305 [Donghicola sp. C2-DW-16]|uniref:Glycerophosphoryl diester phosphodiesterase membrane domain-containing protein n=1 Tax=Donghicola mangrovi TaxID=2729614 RepID=A0ABX2PBJ5_9RHOB|nr:hypothetical protein [Donghicola mangrovi]NVO26044.1 hypothetical protein [Donghicola mangrovi]
MSGWMIFRHAVGMVLRNWRQALQISGFIFAVLVIFQISLERAAKVHIGIDSTMLQTVSPAMWLSMVAYSFVYITLSIWIAVAWHRYILLEELPEGWFPKWHGMAVLRYLGFMVLIGFMIVLAVSVFGFILMMLMPGAMPIFAIFLAIGAVIVSFRLSPLLVAAAIGERMDISEAWEKTSGSTGAILLIIVLQFALSVGLQIPPNLMMFISPVLSFVIEVVVLWFWTLVTASQLTTFYGHFVQERPLV